MDNLVNLNLKYDLEVLQKEARISRALKQSNLSKPALSQRLIPALGEALIRIGIKLVEQSNRKLTSEEASVPTFLIML